MIEYIHEFIAVKGNHAEEGGEVLCGGALEHLYHSYIHIRMSYILVQLYGFDVLLFSVSR